MTALEICTVRTTQKDQWINITGEVQNIVAASRVFMFLVLSFLLIGCSQSAYVGAADISPQRGNEVLALFSAQTPDFEYQKEDILAPQSSVSEKTPKLIKQGNILIRVTDLEAAEALVIAAMDKYGAYASYTETQENFHNYTIRVPEASFQPLLEELKSLGKVLSRSETAEDVTLKYYDLESRLQTKQELRTTFQAYLGTAKTIEDIMSVEARISEVQRELDWMGTELRSLSNLVEYATITLRLEGPPSTVSYTKTALGDRIRLLFGSFGDYASTVLLILLGIIIYGIPGLGILALGYWLLFGKIGLMRKLWHLVSARGKQS